MRFNVQPGRSLTGTIRVPGDKSISHRAIMLGAIAEGVTQVSGFLEGEDAISTMNAFRAMGVRIDGPRQGEVTVRGVGMRGLRAPDAPIDCGNSGTSMRLLSGLLAGQSFACELIGDASLMKRPMRRVADPLARMGARIATGADGRPPVKIAPGERASEIRVAARRALRAGPHLRARTGADARSQ
jgi:5-enolpyruvylshikimate-3-phosphate synthase